MEEAMRKVCIVVIATICSLAFASRAQDTNALKTKLGLIESQTGEIIVKGFSLMGTVPTGGAVIHVRCKESTSAATGQKFYGVALEIDTDEWRRLAVVDYDELDGLLAAMDSLSKITFNATPLQGFEATFTTKSSLEFIAFGDKQQGGIKPFLAYDNSPRIPLLPTQWNQLAVLIAQAKTAIDALAASR
jgi:hypothetical protein